MGNGDHTLTATAIIDGEESTPSEGVSVNITLNCPPTIIDPADGTTTECEQPLTLSGTFDSSVFNSVEIFVDGNSVGFAELNGDNWSFTVPAELVTEGSHTFVAEASTGGSEPFTSQSAPITVTAECPAPPPPPPAPPEPEPEPANLRTSTTCSNQMNQHNLQHQHQHQHQHQRQVSLYKL